MARRWEGKQAEAGRPAGKQASRAGKLVKKTVVGTQTSLKNVIQRDGVTFP